MSASMTGQLYDGDRDDWFSVTDRCAPFIWQVCQRHKLTVAETEKLADAVWARMLSEVNFQAMAGDLKHPRLADWVTTFAEKEYKRLRMDAMRDHGDVRMIAPRQPRAVAGFSVRSLTALAAWLAGREGLALRGESKSHLAGDSGHDPVSWAKISEAAGFVIAGLRYRGQDWADAAWKPVEAVLRSRTLSNLLVVVPTMVVAVEVLTHKGTIGMFTSFGSIFGVGAFLAGVIKAGRWYRNVEPPEPKARRAGNDDQDT